MQWGTYTNGRRTKIGNFATFRAPDARSPHSLINDEQLILFCFKIHTRAHTHTSCPGHDDIFRTDNKIAAAPCPSERAPQQIQYAECRCFNVKMMKWNRSYVRDKCAACVFSLRLHRTARPPYERDHSRHSAHIAGREHTRRRSDDGDDTQGCAVYSCTQSSQFKTVCTCRVDGSAGLAL